MTFITEAGARELELLRDGATPNATADTAPIRLLASLPSEECGCPEELWRLHGITYLIHMEEQVGKGEMFVFLGEDVLEIPVDAASMDFLRVAMFAHFAELSREGDQ